jgi:hypothetical protein
MPNAVRASSRVKARDRPGPRPIVATKAANWVSDDWVMGGLYTLGAENFENGRQGFAAPERVPVGNKRRNPHHPIDLGQHDDERVGAVACPGPFPESAENSYHDSDGLSPRRPARRAASRWPPGANSHHHCHSRRRLCPGTIRIHDLARQINESVTGSRRRWRNEVRFQQKLIPRRGFDLVGRTRDTSHGRAAPERRHRG